MKAKDCHAAGCAMVAVGEAIFGDDVDEDFANDLYNAGVEACENAI